MRLLLTGGYGFIGTNFIKYLVDIDSKIEVLNIDKLTYASNTNGLDSILTKKDLKYKFHQSDIANYNEMVSIINSFQPTCLINFAAESHVDRSINYHNEFIETNIVGTYNLLSASYNYIKLGGQLSKFIHVSTDEVFGSLQENDSPFTEISPYNPSSPYSASKASSDHLVKSWHKTFNFPSILTNCSNNYGPYQFPEKLIPLIIINSLNGEKLPIYGDGRNIRDWLFVKDHCSALFSILNHGNIGESYNIGGNNEVRNIDIVNKICDILDKIKPKENGKKYKDQIEFVEDRPGHDYRYAIDSTKIKNDLNWKQQENFESGLLRTVEWYVNNSKWWNDLRNDIEK